MACIPPRRPSTRLHSTDLSRRTLLRTGLLGATAASLYRATDATVRLTGLPGADRRFTGSHEIGSDDPDAMPSTIWLNDTTPTNPDQWRLTVADYDGRYQLRPPDLTAYDTQVRATLDCTSGWYARQDWTGARVSALIRNVGDANSLLVHSVTGYWIRFRVADIDELLLATRVGYEPLARRHGFPLRLVAPAAAGPGGSSGSTGLNSKPPNGDSARADIDGRAYGSDRSPQAVAAALPLRLPVAARSLNTDRGCDRGSAARRI